uniref:FtsX-like permease family protein n=1 Tax=uncultured Ruthenibacterium sp. TaxID=1905347 RepID=UPI00349E6603
GLVMYVGSENFVQDVYTVAYLTVSGAAQTDSLLDEYDDVVDDIVDKIEDISAARCEIRYDEVKTEAQQELDDARAEYEEKKADAEQQLAEAQQELDDGRAEIESGEKELADAKNQIESGEKELEQNRETLPDTLAQEKDKLTQAKNSLIDAKAQYEDGVKELEDKEQALEDAKVQLENGREQIELLESALKEAESLLPSLETQYQALEAAAQTAEQAAQEGHANSNIGDLQASESEAKAAYEAAYNQRVALEEQLAGMTPEDPDYAAVQEQLAQAQALEQKEQQTYEAAQQAVQTEQSRLDALDSAAATARSQADSAKQIYDEAVTQLNNGRVQLETAKQELEANEQKIADGESQLAAGKAKLAEAKKQITEAEKLIAAGETELNLAPGLAQLEFEQAQQKLDAAQEQYEQGIAELEDAKKQWEDGENEYQVQKQDAEQELADAERQLDDAQKTIDELEMPEWYVLTRDTNVSFASFESNVQKVDAIAKVFPVFFFLVAALVALTTMTRMVEEERLEIGTMKALGYTKRAIMLKYILYAMTASIVGCVVGLTVGFHLFPTVIWNAYSMMYNLPDLYCQFNVKYAVLSSAAAIICTLMATLNAGWATLKETPAQLMLPKAPKAGKRILLERIPAVWKRMKFTYKVTARNLFRYKKRFFMTVVGIAGCTALLVTGFGLHDSISDIVYKQFGEVFTYDVSISLKNQQALDKDGMQEILNDTQLVEGYLPIHQEQSTNSIGSDSFTTYLVVPQTMEDLPQFVDLHTRKGGDPVDVPQDGQVVITEKMSQRMDVGIGDTVELENNDGQTASFTVSGIVENYVENYVYMTANTYRDGFGEEPEFNTVYARSADSSQEGRDTLSEALLSAEGVSSVSFTEDLKETFSNMLEKIDTIVVVLIVSAGVLAFVVLYNLTNINITERVKEIATIKVLGFYDKEVSAYVYRESIALSVIGTLAGLVLGIFLHMFVIRTAEVDAVMFGRSIKVMSYVYSAILTMVFSCLVNLVMHRKLRSISMVESMKAPE